MWSDDKVLAFIRWCAERGAKIVDRRRYFNGDVEFSFKGTDKNTASRLMSEFDKGYKDA